MNKRKFSEAEREIVRRRYPHEPTAPIARELGRTAASILGLAAKLGLKKTPERMRACLADCGRRISRQPGAIASRFAKGHVPANKGLRRPGYGVGRMRETQFKKGQRPRNWAAVGAMTIRSGYAYVKISDAPEPPDLRGGNSPNWKLLHHKVWEDAGNPPVNTRTHALIFKDGNRANCVLENLALIARAENCRRNSRHGLPKPLNEAIAARAALVRAIRRRERGGRNERDPRGADGHASQAAHGRD